MRLRRVLRIGAVAAWGLAIAPLVPSTFGQESGPRLDAMGWWNKTQALPVQGNPSGLDDPTGLGLTTAPTVPAPATVPDDGLYVANDASGPTAITAVRYVVGQAGGTLTLPLADGATLTGAEDVVACPILGGFNPAFNGRWDEQPAYDETACIIEGTLNADSTAFTFVIPSTFASSLGDISVVVVPAIGSTTPFSVPLAKPEDSDFTVTSPVQSPPSTPRAPAYEPGSAVFTAPAASSSFAAPSTPTPAAAPVAADDDVASPAPVALATPAVAADSDRTTQAMAVAILLAIGGALWWLTNQPQRAPRLLGSVGGAAPAVDAPIQHGGRSRGVGRFARPRDVAATRL